MTIRKRPIPLQTFLGCPLTRNRTPWCFRLCKPDFRGCGRCGRVAPHSLRGRTENAITGYLARLRREDTSAT